MARITLFLTIVSIQLHSRGWILPFSEAANCLPPSPLWTTYCRCSGNNCLFNYFKEIGPVETEPMQAAGQTNVRRIRKPGPPCWKLPDVRAIASCFLVKTNAADPRSVLIDLKQLYHPSHCKCCIVAQTRSLSCCDGFCGASEPEGGAHVTCRLADGYLERIRRLFSNL